MSDIRALEKIGSDSGAPLNCRSGQCGELINMSHALDRAGQNSSRFD